MPKKRYSYNFVLGCNIKYKNNKLANILQVIIRLQFVLEQKKKSCCHGEESKVKQEFNEN